MQLPSSGIVRDASYFIIQGQEKAIPTGGVPCAPRWVMFYTASGDRIGKAYCSFKELLDLKNRLDPQAPKPQPATYSIDYWDADYASQGLPGYFIIFKDNHGNHIDSYRYNIDTQTIEVPSTKHRMKELASLQQLKKLDVSRICSTQENPELAKDGHQIVTWWRILQSWECMIQ